MIMRECRNVPATIRDGMRRILIGVASIYFWFWAEGDPTGIGAAVWWVYENDLNLSTKNLMKGKCIKITVEFERIEKKSP